MIRRLAIAAFCSLALLGATTGAATASTTWQPCLNAGTSIDCANFTMPLDRTGAVPGTTTVRAVRLAATEGPRMGTMFVIAGGPGQGALAMIDLVASSFEGANRYDLIAVDQRGSGYSEPLNCPRIERWSFDWDGSDPKTDQPFTDCANALGPARAAYNTVEAVADLETVRADLAVDNATFFGVSYGTKVALAYAKAHPNRTKALLLDSVLPTDMPGKFDTDSLAATRSALSTICKGSRCNAVGKKPIDSTKQLAKRLNAKPLPNFLVMPGGKIDESPIDATALYEIIAQADFNSYIYSQLPGMVSAALRGQYAQLVQLYALINGAFESEGSYSLAKRAAKRVAGQKQPAKPRGYEDLALFSNTMFFATTCADFDPPWTRGDNIAGRQAAIDAAAGQLTAAELSPFPRKTVAAMSTSAYCRGWPQSPTAPAIDQGPLPNIPTLALAGDLDLRTPVAWAERAIAGNPRAQLVKIPNVGHSVIGMDISGCALSLAKRFLLFGATDGKCKETAEPVPVAPRAATSLRSLKSARGSCKRMSRRGCVRAKRAITAGYLAARDAFDQMLIGNQEAGPGLYFGSWMLEWDDEDMYSDFPFMVSLLGMSSAPGSITFGSVSISDFPNVDGSLVIGGYRASISGRIAYDRKGDRITISARRGRTRVKIQIGNPRSSKRAAPSRSHLNFRRSYALAGGQSPRNLAR